LRLAIRYVASWERGWTIPLAEVVHWACRLIAEGWLST
jgi:hypothetical protein